MNISGLCKFGVFPNLKFIRKDLISFYAKNKRNATYRNSSTKNSKSEKDYFFFNQNLYTIRNYIVAVGVTTLGLAYAAVPLYRIFCQATGYGGTTQHDIGGEKVEKLKKVPDRFFTVKFNSDISRKIKWKFYPQQRELVVVPGETALAFFKASNPLDKPVTGISTYNILPYEAAPYFNKIQCFCFEEQQLNPNEEVDMPVFFYIDPEICEDPQLENLKEIVLSYTFFEAKEGLPLQGFSDKAKK